MAYVARSNLQLRSLHWPLDFADRVALIAAYWHTTEWYVVNSMATLGLDMLEDMILDNLDWVPPGAPSIRDMKAKCFRGKRRKYV
jgi:hypothetical protein